MKTQGGTVARSAGVVRQKAKGPAWSWNRHWIKEPSPRWPILIGRPAAAKMVHLSRTGRGRKQSFATGSLAPQLAQGAPIRDTNQFTKDNGK
jgi:hypothetical protein